MKNQIVTSDKKPRSDGEFVEISPEIENKMRILANLIIDRIFEDQKNCRLKFKSTPKNLQATDNKLTMNIQK